MKALKLISIILLLLLLNACSNSSDNKDTEDTKDIPKVGSDLIIDTAGLVLYLPFSGNAEDKSTTLNHTSVDGPLPTTDRTNTEDMAYEFDGDDDAIELPHHNAYNITKEISLTAWIYPTQIKSQTIIRKGAAVNGPTTSPYSLSLSGSGDIILSLNIDDKVTQLRKRNYDINKWSHIVGTYDGETMKLYINGLLEESLLITGELNTNEDALLIGSRLKISSSTFKGKIDDIMIYNKSLSSEYIKTLFN